MAAIDEFAQCAADINAQGLAAAEAAQRDNQQEEDIPTIFNVPIYNMPYVEERIAKVNKRAAKLGAEPVRIVNLGQFDEKIRKANTYSDDMSEDAFTVVTKVKIQIVGKAPSLNGWTLVSVVEQTDTGVMMRKFPGTELEIPIEFRGVSPSRCDHCHTNRQRNETFIVYRPSTQEWKVVGRTCLKDFTGCGNPEGYANYAETLRDLMADVGAVGQERMSGCWGKGDYYCAAMKSFLTDVAVYIGRYGFVSSKKAYESRDTDNPLEATGKRVFNDQYMPIVGDGECARRERMARKAYRESITDAEQEKADAIVDAALQYGKTQFIEPGDETLTDYAHNMRVLLTKDYVRIIDVGFVASLISGYLRSIEKKLDYSGSKHVGTIGQKILLPVTILKVYPWEGQYGLVNITTMKDDDGNILTWFAKAEAKTRVPEVGKYLTMNAKVSRHDDRNGNKTTVVQYVKFM